MQRNRFFLVLAVTLLPLTGAFSQTASMNNTQTGNTSQLLDINGENWTFYLDKENKIYYIDFETISVNLSDIQVRNESGEIVMEEKLWDLPVNAIYELDMSKWKPGKYKIELRTYTGVIKRELEVAD